MKHLTILAMMMVLTISAKAMSYEQAKDEALFLTDKMAYELSLTDEQYEAVYEINLDYMLCLNKHDDLFGVYWERRNADLRLVLSDWQYEKYLAIEYFNPRPTTTPSRPAGNPGGGAPGGGRPAGGGPGGRR